MKLLQINSVANSGSTGKIAEGIGLIAQKSGFESVIAYGRYANRSQSKLIQIGRKWEYLEHGIESRIFDNHGLASRHATKKFIRQIQSYNPDIIHLHNIHGYYINFLELFNYFKETNIPVVWTLHDCWPITGHCVHFDFCGCTRWKTCCCDCPQKKTYPKSLFFDSSARNFMLKRDLFSQINNLFLIPVSNWLNAILNDSFLCDKYRSVIYNGIDTNVFSPTSGNPRKKFNFSDADLLLLGVASVWSERKGLKDFIELSKFLSPETKLILVGLSNSQIAKLPDNIIGIERTESAQELAELYSASDIFLNLTYEDNYPTTNLEAISCGTPCLTYQTGGSPESITPQTGFVVKQGDIRGVLDRLQEFKSKKKEFYTSHCREYALEHFCQDLCFQKYIDLYNMILS